MKRRVNLRRPRIGNRTKEAAMGAGIGYSYMRGSFGRFGPNNRKSSNSIETYNPFADTVGSMTDDGASDGN